MHLYVYTFIYIPTMLAHVSVLTALLLSDFQSVLRRFYA